MMLALATLMFGLQNPVVFAFTETAPSVRVLWVPINPRPPTRNLLIQELGQSFKESTLTITPKVTVTTAPANSTKTPNPFKVTKEDFYAGFHLPLTGPQGPVPTIQPADAAWFTEQVRKNEFADVFFIGGHHVISMGWQSPGENAFVYAPTLLDTLERYPDARKYFNHIKIAILWGCNTLTNLQPHGDHGEYLSPEVIKTRYESSDAEAKRLFGLPKSGPFSVRAYQQHLYDSYGPNSGPDEYAWTKKASDEKCSAPGPYNCEVLNLNRVFPARYMWSPEEPYNEPMNAKKMFPNAYLVLGYSSGSPPEETRARIFKIALDETRKELKKKSHLAKYAPNVLYAIISDHTPDLDRKDVIEELRKQWTLSTYKHNRGRPSGSVTPAYPQLDDNGIYNIEVDKFAPTFAPYRPAGTKALY